MQKVCETIGLFDAEGQCKSSAERSLLQLCRGAACPRPTGQYLATATMWVGGSSKTILFRPLFASLTEESNRITNKLLTFAISSQEYAP